MKRFNITLALIILAALATGFAVPAINPVSAGAGTSELGPVVDSARYRAVSSQPGG